MRIDYKLRDKFDFGLFLPVLILICIGLAAIYSSTVNHPTAHGNFEKQLVWAIASIIVFFILYSLPTNTFKTISVPAYLLSLFLLILVLVIGRRTSGAKSWLDLGAVGFQPSEFAKIGIVLAMAAFLSRRNTDIDSLFDIVISLAIGFIPVALVLLEPDMGTSLIIIAVIIALIFWKGISLFSLFVVLSPGIVAFSSLFGTFPFIVCLILVAGGIYFFKKDIFIGLSVFGLNLGAGFFTDYVYNALSPHQQRRIMSFMDPSADPLGAGYNAMQAKLAIGSGGFWGKGFLAGNQTQLQFIPEQWTDFIYCVIGEEFGFIGSALVVILFLILFLRLFKIANQAKDEFLSLVLFGIMSVYFLHFLINVGMDIGIMPVIGIPLPFVSYGGSSLLVNMIMIGIAANIYRTKKNYT
ncbi:MAG TPA: rod shape-determining protein RodA [Ignavibacteriaceae bacterium]|nr:rod shape-determining protein RodA [Ignavibacteriaceae bacterium]